MKSHADCSFIDAAPLRVEGEHGQFGSGGASVSLLHVVLEPLRQLRPHRHDSAFGELRLPDEQQIAGEIGIAYFQS
jgi:hypothetical protein